jgi:hypothetical protein
MFVSLSLSLEFIISSKRLDLNGIKNKMRHLIILIAVSTLHSVNSELFSATNAMEKLAYDEEVILKAFEALSESVKAESEYIEK